jgi:hypothetical protein
MELWELAARERIRDSLALYNWSGDAFRLGELALAFCEDGELEIRGRQPLRGRDAIVAFLGAIPGGASEPGGSAEPGGAPEPGGSAEPGDPADGAGDEARRQAQRAAAAASGVRRIVRHALTNTRFLELTPARARVACYFTVFTQIGLDHYGRYRDTFVPVGDEWLIRHRFVSTDWRAPASTMAPPSSIS